MPAAVLLSVSAGRVPRLAARLGLLIAAVLIAVSGTPLPLWAYVLWAASAVWLLAASRSTGTRTRVRRSTAVVLACTVAVSLWEASYHVSPVLRVPRGASILVVGDSITAGLSDDVTKWHETFGRQGSYVILDLARAGATQESALSLLRKQANPGTTVPLAILEIGGNDMLAKEPPEKFESELDDLLSETAARADRILLMELPTPPFYNRYGDIQRRLARKHGAILVPKRVFARVLGAPGATLDGLHLSQSGHDLMARQMGLIVRQ
jgi:acyl-CoA thioesterase-1